ncbi:MAG: hypothetical protein HYT61_01615 [Candidatus Yanofskybacteria bacterium]|nr:hypothetical protein [Candidatus Yanofskybacteria bacterium]
MGNEADGPADVVIFFDANMPNMDKCSDNCSKKGKDLVFCVHRFNFKAQIIYPGKKLDRLDDFQVIKYFFDLIRNNKAWEDPNKRPLFVLVTKDHNFVQDAQSAHQRAIKSPKANLPGFHYAKDRVYDDYFDFEIIVQLINCENYGTNRQDNLRCTIRELNKLWALL